jgi:hypothetical protein
MKEADPHPLSTAVAIEPTAPVKPGNWTVMVSPSLSITFEKNEKLTRAVVDVKHSYGGISKTISRSATLSGRAGESKMAVPPMIPLVVVLTDTRSDPSFAEVANVGVVNPEATLTVHGVFAGSTASSTVNVMLSGAVAFEDSITPVIVELSHPQVLATVTLPSCPMKPGSVTVMLSFTPRSFVAVKPRPTVTAVDEKHLK